jgi:hypothetical protein
MLKPQLASGLGRLKSVSGLEPPPAPSMPAETAPAPSREPGKRPGMVQIAGHFDLAVRRQLDMIGLLQNRTSQDLLAEALNDLFVKYNQSAIAPVYGEGSRSKPRAR